MRWADSIYHTYASLVNGAKAILLSENVKTNTQANIIAEFDETFKDNSTLSVAGSFADLVYQIQNNEPSKEFAESYLSDANAFFERADLFRKNQLAHAN